MVEDAVDVEAVEAAVAAAVESMLVMGEEEVL